MTVRGAGLTARTVLITCAVAVISVLVTAIVALQVTARFAQSDAQEALSSESQFVADMLNTAPNPDNMMRRLRVHNFNAILIRGGHAEVAGLPEDLVRSVTEGSTVSNRIIVFNGRRMLVDARPLLEPGDGVVLMDDAVTSTAGEVWRRLGLALAAGLLAGLIAGFLLARRQARPILQAAAAARRMSAGDRGVRLPVKPPNEVADLARALNDLAAALSTSEGRQRDFLLSVSHELRTPLTTIRGYAEALADGVISGDTAPGAGRTMLAEADRLDRLVTDLLALARLEAADFPVELVPVELGSLISAAADAWRPRCTEAGLELRTELPPGPVIVQTDPGRLRQVIDILIENALRVLPTGEPLVLATGSTYVEVRDGGPGLADEDLPVAFHQGVLHEKYRDVRKVGTGLGLALAARLVSRMSGEIEAGHAREGGARFTVRL